MNYMQNLMQLRRLDLRKTTGAITMFRYIITLLIICCLPLQASADEIQLKADHPERYTVVKGDTLWDISGRFLKNPWLWPQVWKLNRSQIKNPHLIYPGDVVFLDMSSGTPQLRLLRETVTLQPGAREETLEKQAIPTISPNIIAPFLNQPLVIENNSLDTSPFILASPDGRVILSQNSKIYVNKIEQGQGLLWHIYRPGNNLVDPDSKEILGMEALYLGDAKITKYGAPASAYIVSAKEEIVPKDKLVVANDELQKSFVPRAPDTNIEGRIISIYGGLAETGRNAIVAINKGSKDGLEQGHVLTISRKGAIIKNPNAPEPKGWFDKFKSANSMDPSQRYKDYSESAQKAKAEDEELKSSAYMRLPNERVGLLMIFRTFDRVSYGLIMQSSEPINILDVVATPE